MNTHIFLLAEKRKELNNDGERERRIAGRAKTHVTCMQIHVCQNVFKHPKIGYRCLRTAMRHGGKCNASTGDDKTCYQFDVSPAFLEAWPSMVVG